MEITGRFSSCSPQCQLYPNGLQSQVTPRAYEEVKHERIDRQCRSCSLPQATSKRFRRRQAAVSEYKRIHLRVSVKTARQALGLLVVRYMPLFYSNQCIETIIFVHVLDQLFDLIRRRDLLHVLPANCYSPSPEVWIIRPTSPSDSACCLAAVVPGSLAWRVGSSALVGSGRSPCRS